MSVIWAFLRPLIGPAIVVVLTLLAAWLAYNEGKSAGRASYADEIAACEQRRADDHAKLIADREAVLAERTALLAAAAKKLEESKHENERLRQQSAKIASENTARHAALDAALASLRFRAAGGAGGTVSGTSGSTGQPDGGTTECRACAAELEALSRRAAHDALTVLEWQNFYSSLAAPPKK